MNIRIAKRVYMGQPPFFTSPFDRGIIAKQGITVNQEIAFWLYFRHFRLVLPFSRLSHTQLAQRHHLRGSTAARYIQRKTDANDVGQQIRTAIT